MTTTPAPAIRDLLATPEPLGIWLYRQDPETIVGYRGVCESCPLAAFLEAHGIEFPSVGKFDVQYREWDTHIQTKLPEWATEFVKQIDTQGYGRTVTARDALVALAEVAA